MRLQLTNTAVNIIKFNDSVRSQVRQVHASGKQVEDQLAYLWKTYLTAPDRDFHRICEIVLEQLRRWNFHYMADQLMLLMENKYKNRVLTGEWGAPPEEQVKIVASTAQVDVLKKELATKSRMKKQESRMEDNEDKGTRGDSKSDWQKKPPTNNQLEKMVNAKTTIGVPTMVRKVNGCVTNQRNVTSNQPLP